MRFVRRAPSTQFTCTRTGLVLINVAMCMTRDDRTMQTRHDSGTAVGEIDVRHDRSCDNQKQVRTRVSLWKTPKAPSGTDAQSPA